MKFRWPAGAVFLACIASCMTVPSTPPPRTAATDPLALMERVADWQLAHLDDAEMYRSQNRTLEPRGWVQGAFYVGLTTLAERSKQPRFTQAIMDHGKSQSWRLGDRLLHADDHVIGQSYLWAYKRTRDPAAIAPTRESFDAILANRPTVSLDFEAGPAGGERQCQTRWCWSDALFMSPPTWARLSAATGDPRYLDYADAEFRAATDYLYDREEHLYYRDSRFHRRRDEAGRKIFWSRGNGWVVGGIVHMLEALPPNHASRPYYEQLLKEMAAKLITLQRDDGYWSTSLLAADTHPAPETSGAGFFVYGLAWGVNHGLLDERTYRDAIDRGWNALTRAVQADGKLGWVQRIGYAPDQVSADDTQFYGVGAFLLGGSQIHDMQARPQRPGSITAPVIN